MNNPGFERNIQKLSSRNHFGAKKRSFFCLVNVIQRKNFIFEHHHNYYDKNFLKIIKVWQFFIIIINDDYDKKFIFDERKKNEMKI